jgi:hypothetical protein
MEDNTMTLYLNLDTRKSGIEFTRCKTDVTEKALKTMKVNQKHELIRRVADCNGTFLVTVTYKKMSKDPSFGYIS